ncbi:MAG: hypothetical protein QE271_06930 [Bacteriovoracaceae bacterium]|nr:hypothetical protein [Bacteriovoracaceae bacterium]
MLPNLLSELRTKKKSNFSGKQLLVEEGSEVELGEIYFLAGTPIHFTSSTFGNGFAGLLEFYFHQRHIMECRYEDDIESDLFIVDHPTINYHFDRLVINLLDSYQEKKALHKILSLSSESIISY